MIPAPRSAMGSRGVFHGCSSCKAAKPFTVRRYFCRGGVGFRDRANAQSQL